MCSYRSHSVPRLILGPFAWFLTVFEGGMVLFVVPPPLKSPRPRLALDWQGPKKSGKSEKLGMAPQFFDPTKYRPKVPKRRKNMFFSTFSSRWSDCARSRSILKNIFKKVLSFKKVVHKKLKVHFRPTRFPHFTSKICAIDRSPRQLSGDMKIIFFWKIFQKLWPFNFFGRNWGVGLMWI